jgi:hypothetical protein
MLGMFLSPALPRIPHTKTNWCMGSVSMAITKCVASFANHKLICLETVLGHRTHCGHACRQELSKPAQRGTWPPYLQWLGIVMLKWLFWGCFIQFWLQYFWGLGPTWSTAGRIVFGFAVQILEFGRIWVGKQWLPIWTNFQTPLWLIGVSYLIFVRQTWRPYKLWTCILSTWQCLANLWIHFGRYQAQTRR